LLLIRNSFCFWLRKYVDAREFAVTRTETSKRASARLKQLEVSAKAQTLKEWQKSITTNACLASNSQPVW
jgi:hypothetical protein